MTRTCFVPVTVERLEQRRLLSAGQWDMSFAGDGSFDVVLPTYNTSTMQVRNDHLFAIIPTAGGNALRRYPLNGGQPAVTLYAEQTEYHYAGLTGLDVLPDGSVIAQISAGGPAGGATTAKRITADGSVDPVFPTFPISTYASLTTYATHTLRFVGTTNQGGAIYYGALRHAAPDPMQPTTASNLLLIIKPDGSFEQFGGRANYDLHGDTGFDAYAFDTIAGQAVSGSGLLLLADGRMLLYGRTTDQTEWFVARLNADGSVDPTFGTDGLVTGTLEGFPARVRGAQATSDGAVIIELQVNDESRGVAPITQRLLRLRADGSADPLFHPIDDEVARFTDWLVQPDDRLVVRSLDAGGDQLIRYRADGQLDAKYTAFDTTMVSLPTLAGMTAEGDILLFSGDEIDNDQWEVRLRAIDSGLPATPGQGEVRVGGGDFNLDGREDVLVYDPATGQMGVWLMEGEQRLAHVSLLSVGDTDWHPAAVGDMNGDGRVDIVFRHMTTGKTLYWEMNQVGLRGVVNLPSAALGWRLVGSADFDGNAAADLVWQHVDTRKVSIWLNDGSQIIYSAAPFATNPDWTLAAIADIDRDGRRDDLLWRNQSDGRTLAWVMDAPRQIRGMHALARTADPAWQLYGVADLDEDGYDDLLWYKPATGAHITWLRSLLAGGRVATLPPR